MCALIKWLAAAAVLTVVVCAAGDGACCTEVAACAAEGLAVGTVYGLVAAFAAVDDGARLTPWRLRVLVAHGARVGLISGLLIGVARALPALLA